MKKILVCIKRVVDYNVRVRVKPDGSGVMLDGVKMSVNPFDEIALEEALRIKERGSGVEVVAVSIGVADSQQQLRTALAMGADRAILVQTDAAVEPLTAARTFLAVAKKESPDLIFSANRPSTMMPTRPDKCSPPSGSARRQLTHPRSRLPTARRRSLGKSMPDLKPLRWTCPPSSPSIFA